MTEKNTFTDRKELIVSVMSSLMKDALECLRFIEKIECLEKKSTENEAVFKSSIIAQDVAEHYEALTELLSDHRLDNFNAISERRENKDIDLTSEEYVKLRRITKNLKKSQKRKKNKEQSENNIMTEFKKRQTENSRLLLEAIKLSDKEKNIDDDRLQKQCQFS